MVDSRMNFTGDDHGVDDDDRMAGVWRMRAHSCIAAAPEDMKIATTVQ